MTDSPIEKLSSFNDDERREALHQIAARAPKGELSFESAEPKSNVHLHTFFSFNAAGYSPSRIIYEAGRRRLEVAATVDFDVLDAAQESLQAGDLLGVKTATGLESRVFIRDYAGVVMNSPNEPGIYYLVGEGFTEAPLSAQGQAVLGKLRRIANARTRGVMDRVNAHLGEVRLDFDRDVAPLTPRGNATERHLLAAYDHAARAVFPKRRNLARFWSGKLGQETAAVEGMLDETAAFHELVRKKLMKFGAPGYAAPDEGSFPTIEEVVAMIRDAGAIPSAAFLDGTSDGEKDMERFLAFCLDKGIEALTVIPERNWRLTDPDEKALKLANLADCLAIARRLDMPILAGTEMNKPGQPFVDAFERDELAPFTDDFLAGAHLLYGHTLLQRARGWGMLSDWTREHFNNDRYARNAFFIKAGRLAAPGAESVAHLKDLSAASPEELIEAIQS